MFIASWKTLLVALTAFFNSWSSFGVMFSLVFKPGASSAISKEVLRAATNDNEGSSNRTIVFTIVNPPKFGKLVTVQTDKSKTEVSSFTQKMVSGVNLHASFAWKGES